ncbi:hypothetical protein ACFFJW_22210, partial [Micromonospora siamensis]
MRRLVAPSHLTKEEYTMSLSREDRIAALPAHVREEALKRLSGRVVGGGIPVVGRGEGLPL